MKKTKMRKKTRQRRWGGERCIVVTKDNAKVVEGNGTCEPTTYNWKHEMIKVSYRQIRA